MTIAILLVLKFLHLKITRTFSSSPYSIGGTEVLLSFTGGGTFNLYSYLLLLIERAGQRIHELGEKETEPQQLNWEESLDS